MPLFPPIPFIKKDGTEGTKLSREGKDYILSFVNDQWRHCKTPGEIPLSTRHLWLEQTGISYTTLTALLVNTMRKRTVASHVSAGSGVAGPSGVRSGFTASPLAPLPSPLSTSFDRQGSTPFDSKHEVGALVKFKAKEDILFRSFTTDQKNQLQALFEVEPDVLDLEARFWGPPMGLTEEQSLQWVRVRRTCSIGQSPAPRSRQNSASVSISPRFLKRELSVDGSRLPVPLFLRDTQDEDLEIDGLSEEDNECNVDSKPERSALPTPSATISPDPQVLHNFEGTASPNDRLWDGTVFGEGEHREGSPEDATRSMTISPVLDPVALHEERTSFLKSSLESAQSYANAMADPSRVIEQKSLASDTVPLMDMLRDLKSTDDVDVKDDETIGSGTIQNLPGPSDGALPVAPAAVSDLSPPIPRWANNPGLGGVHRRASLGSDERAFAHSGPHRTLSDPRTQSRARPYPPPAIDTFQGRTNPVSPALTSGSSWTTLNSPPLSATSSPLSLHSSSLTPAQRMRLAVNRAAKNKDPRVANMVDEEALKRRPEEMKKMTAMLQQCATSSRSGTPMRSPM